MTAEVQNSGRRVEYSVARSLTSSLWTLHTLSEEKHVGRFRSVLVGFGRFSAGFGRFRSVSEVSGALGGALRRVLSVKC